MSILPPSGVLQLQSTSVSSFDATSEKLGQILLDISALNTYGLGAGSRFFAVTRVNASTNPVTAVAGGTQIVSSTSAASPGALTHTLPNPATAGAISVGDTFWFTDETFNASTYNITISCAGSAKIYGPGISTAGTTSVVIKKNGGGVLLQYITTNTFYILYDNRQEVGLLSTTTGINGKTVATTDLYTVPTGYTAIIEAAVIRCTTATSVTDVPTLGIGVAAGEADIFAATALTGLTATTKIWRFAGSGLYVNVAAGGVIKCGIDVGATGTAQTLAIDLFGYLI